MKRLVRFLLASIVLWCVLVEIAEAVAGWRFGMELDGDWLLLLTGSSAGELRTFFLQHAGLLSAAVLSFLLSAVAVTVLSLRASRRFFLVFLVLAVVGLAGRVACVGSFRAWKPAYVAYDTLRGWRLYGEIVAAGAWTEARAVAVREAPAGAANYVFVIGESLTASRLSFYGYGKRTTPELEKLGDRLARLGPIRASSPYTVRALADLFVADGVSAPVCFRQAGYETLFVSAQSRWGRYGSVESSVFAACSQRVYLDEAGKGGPVYDEGLLPYVKAMVSGLRPFALFVHLMGSHFDPRDRVPEGFAADEGLDDYDRSVRYTDKVLASIIGLLPPRTVLYFISDHGESVDCPGWRNVGSASLWSVPVLAYPAESAVPISSVADFRAMWYNLPKQ